MNRSPLFLLFLLLCTTPIGLCSGQSERPFILLKSGSIHEGRTEDLGSQSRILFPNGDYFVLPTDQIEKTFRTKRDIFRYKLAITPLEGLAQHRLFQWLCSQNAYQFAHEHLQELKTSAPQLGEFDFAAWDQKILNQKSLTRSRRESSHTISSAQSRFDRKVSAHLVMGCSISGCHRRSEKSTYQLAEFSDLTAQKKNYENTRKMIQRLGSKYFLEKVSLAHGPLRRGIYPTATREYLAIATWVNSLEKKEGTSRPHEVTSISKQSNQATSITSIPDFHKTSLPTPQQTPTRIDKSLQSDRSFIPRDEFDPEIFNRMQRGEFNQPVSEAYTTTATPKARTLPDKPAPFEVPTSIKSLPQSPPSRKPANRKLNPKD